MALRREVADRVYYGWIIAGACLLASMVVFGTSYAFGVFYESFIDTYDTSRTALAVAFGLQTFVLYVAAVGAGRLIDRYGQRRVVAVGGAVMTAGLVGTAGARSYLELLVTFGLVTAVGMGALFVVGYATVPLWFERRRGAAAGFASAGLGIGLVAIPPGANVLIGIAGWRSAMLGVAAVVGVLSAIIALLVADDHESVGADRSVEFAESSSMLGNGGSVGSDPRVATETLASRSFLLVAGGWVLAFGPLYVVLSHVVLHAGDVGVGRGVGVAAITAIGVATTVSRLVIGVLSDHVGRTSTFAACAAGMGATAVLFAIASSPTTFLAVAILFGVMYGGCGGLLAPLVADLFGNADLNTLFAAATLSFAVSGLAAPPLAGRVFETVGSYDPAFVAVGLLGIGGAGCVTAGARLS